MNLKKLELEMLEQVYNVFLNIPDTVVASIPSLKTPSVLVELKRIRQKVKNKIKIGEKRLTNEYSKPSTLSNKNIFHPESKSRTSFINEIDVSNSLCENQTSNFSKHETNCTSVSRLSTYTTYNQTNDNISTNKWFNNHSDFQTNTSPSNYIDVYSRERLSLNQLDLIVNDENVDSFSVSNVQKSIQSCSINDKSLQADKHTRLETNKLPSQNNFKGKTIDIIFMSHPFNEINIFMNWISIL